MIKTALYRSNTDKEHFYRCASLSIKFTISRRDIFELIANEIVLEKDSDYSEDAHAIEYAESRLKEHFNTAKNAEETIRKELRSSGLTFRHSDNSWTEQMFLEHRPLISELINNKIDKLLPQFQLTDRDQKLIANAE